MPERKTLLQRYEIPLNHLDFGYIKECEDAREMERIVHILQSGEEGYYPDLTQCAEDKLRVLKPNSRLFRYEGKVLRGDEVSETELQPIKDFSREARVKDRRLAAADKDENDGLPPIRVPGKISLNSKDKADGGNKNNGAGDAPVTKPAIDGKKIRATDYRKWDRYDPDEEILRMDLAEERMQEEIERKNRLNAQKSEKTPLIEEIKEEPQRLTKLTDIERETLAEEYRLRGNEYFRSKDYEFALAEYSRTISLNPEKDAAAYNNRAITYIKLKKYSDAIKDCQKCLSIEPDNIKAKYRLALSNMEIGCKEKALQLFTEVLELDPSHTNAKNLVNTLRTQLSEQPPAHATRLAIEDVPIPKSSTSKTPSKEVPKPSAKIQSKPSVVPTKTKASPKETKPKDYDLASLVRPKEIVPNKWMDNAAQMIKNTSNENENQQQKDSKPFEDIQTRPQPLANDNEMALQLPMTINQASTSSRQSKPLIEEL